MKPTIADTEAAVLDVIAGRAAFEDALAAVVAYQRAWVPALDAFWTRRGYTGGTDVPGVPTDVFRSAMLCSAEHTPTRVFRTSGTTHGARGAHHRFALRAYDEGAIRHVRETIGLDVRAPIVPLVFDPAEVPDSSLSYMVGQFVAASEVAATPYALRPEGLDIDAARHALASQTRPCVVFGTAWAFVHLLDGDRDPIRLPEGSMTVETGGYKGRSRVLEPDELRALITSGLAVPTASQCSEYSMTELSSQLYRMGNGPYQAPSWCRVDAVDPLTLTVLPPGHRGLLRFIDLANVETVVSVQTSDVGTVTDAGVVLEGRAAGAAPRGCSLAVEEVLALL